MSKLPLEVVQEDTELEGRIGKMSERLAKLRWHWTLDESNPARVSLRQYARDVGKGFSTIHSYANGYPDHRDRDIPISEAIQLAGMSSETESATKAVSGAREVSVSTAKQSRSTEVRRVREIARERAEKHGTTVEEEAPQVAEWIVKTEQAGKQISAERKERLGLRFVEMEAKLDKVKRGLVEAVRLAQEIGWGDEEVELLQHDLANIKSLLHLVDVALIGSTDVDWDKELAKLAEEAA